MPVDLRLIGRLHGIARGFITLAMGVAIISVALIADSVARSLVVWFAAVLVATSLHGPQVCRATRREGSR